MIYCVTHLTHLSYLTRVVSFTALLFCSARLSALDWYRWRGPDLNGISSETGWQSKWSGDGPKRVWRAAVGTGFSSFSVSNGRVYTMGNTHDTDTVFCFDAATGQLIWKHAYACPLDPKYFEGGPGATPTVADGRVYTISRQGHLFCLDAAKATVIWKKNLNVESGLEIPTWGFAGSALVEGDRVFLNMGSAGAALEKSSGKVVWISGKDAGGYSTPVPFSAGDERRLALFTKDSIAAIRAGDGRALWSYPWKTSYDVNAAEPIIEGDKVFISAGYNHGAALLKLNGNAPEELWENKNMRNHFNSCVLWKGYLYGVDENQLRCLAFDTGEVKWTDRDFGKGSLMVADGKLIGMSEKGELIIAEATPQAFKPISRTQVLTGRCWTTPVLSNGRIYCRNAAGQVVCVDVSTK
ncbi:MAG: alcohol dehydrogenase [Verrucomicrobia bacterium]|nr:MAG: alcohol dehydrogenase [Verrucomicrobiota bacterium]